MTTESSSRQVRGIGLILLAATLWGTVGIATKTVYQLADTNALSIGFFRLAFALPALFVASWWQLGRGLFAIPRRDLALMAGIGAGMATYQVCYMAAIPLVGVAISVLVTLCTAPVIIALSSALVLRETVSRRVIVAMGCALLGTALLVGINPADGADSGRTLLGVGLALGSATSYALITLCSRSLTNRYHPLQPITIGFAFGALFLLPFALGAGLTLSFPAFGWGALIYLGLLPTALGYILFISGIRNVSATIASIVTLVEPLVATVLAWWLFGEQLGPLGILGAVLLIGAIVLLMVVREPAAQQYLPEAAKHH